ncbi:hypothetical protein ACLHDG_01810 [Sulfurovum sp. CS9]|uniref:hypothetical protein n=1 Tax=Sulfurovum sp. CS9 TaxID=3391146 RepID=UPI0039ED7E10
MKQFSEAYYPFSKTQSWRHEANNKWFENCLKQLEKKQLLKIDDIPYGPKYFNKEGEEMDAFGKPVEKYSLIVSDFINQTWGGVR